MRKSKSTEYRCAIERADGSREWVTGRDAVSGALSFSWCQDDATVYSAFDAYAIAETIARGGRRWFVVSSGWDQTI